MGIASASLYGSLIALVAEADPGGIAPRVTQEIYELLHQLRESEHLTALIVEQNAQVALNLVNRAYVLESGRITAKGTAAELREDDAVRRSYLGH